MTDGVAITGVAGAAEGGGVPVPGGTVGDVTLGPLFVTVKFTPYTSNRQSNGGSSPVSRT